VDDTVVKIGYLFLGVFDLYFIGFACYLSFMEKPVLEKSVTLDFKIGFGFPIVLNEPTIYDGFGNKIFFLELGLWLMSGKNDYPVFYIRYTF